MRRAVTLFCTLALVLGLPGAASAGRPYRATDHTVSLFCDGIVGTGGSGFVYFGATLSDTWGPDGWLDAWAGSEPSGPPDLSRDWDQPPVVTWNGTTLAGSFALRDDGGQAAGTATFSATLDPVGEPQPFNDAFKDGNRQVRFTGESQVFQPSGVLTLPTGATFDLANCFADETTFSVFETNPNAYTARFSQRFASCDLSNTAGDSGFLFVGFEADGVFVDAGLFPADGSGDRGAFGFSGDTDGTVSLSLEVYDLETGTSTGETGSVSLTATATGESFTSVLQNATAKRTTRGETLDIEGTLTIAGHSFDLTACVGMDSTTKEISTNPQGPRPGGKVPANDLPSGAKALKPGGSATQQTRGASPDAEAPYECLTFTDHDTGEVFVVPVGHTVWYSFVGTGSSMTIDTVGSDYDTVVAIYTSSGGSLVPVPDGCADDVSVEPFGRTLQSSVTIPTIAGTTYLVQIGGFPESFTYGNLRVTLR